jgi:hypothetical protein
MIDHGRIIPIVAPDRVDFVGGGRLVAVGIDADDARGNDPCDPR